MTRVLVLPHLRAIYIAGIDELRRDFDAAEAAGYNLDATGYLPSGSTCLSGVVLTDGALLAYSHVRRPHDYKPSAARPSTVSTTRE